MHAYFRDTRFHRRQSRVPRMPQRSSRTPAKRARQAARSGFFFLAPVLQLRSAALWSGLLPALINRRAGGVSPLIYGGISFIAQSLTFGSRWENLRPAENSDPRGQ